MVGPKRIIDNLSFAVDAGETLALAGSNGSGKTTTLRCLLGTMRPTSGRALIAGSPFSPRNSTRVGYLPEERGLYRKERVLDVMSYFGHLKGLDRVRARKEAVSYLERVGLGDKQRSRLDKLSGGQHQKVQLGIAIMNEPHLLVLDEPTKGLDPINRQLLMDLVVECQARGSGVILVTHHMEEIERLCQRALVLRDGVAKAHGTIAEIQAAFGSRRILVRSADVISESTTFSVESRQGDLYRLIPRSGAPDRDILSELVATGSRVARFEPQKTSMQEIFVRLYSEDAA
ncbi:ABC transporter ATP-binding protein [Frondihabitans sucicola]|uniref:ABC transporter ATP-binding protein n=2 Tax=Frondihabitans sucicola TaxID=1268041 RepID=A0ABM8GUL3_9MICO|nr:ABC transporter ATP-binding protein [Frondihabitans sucicola]